LGAGLEEETSVGPTAAGNDPTVDFTKSQAEAAAPGARLSYFGDYELLEEVARGGMGVVFKARQITLDRIVAVKMILAGHLASRVDVERFRAEAEAAANLRHPNIVAIHEVGEHHGQHYFSMDFVEGQSLAEIVREGPLPPRTAATYVKQIAEAIHYAHQRGTLHRDLKPANVLVDAAGEVHITDFGLAKRTDRGADLTVTGSVLGTPAYMPPEQAAGRRGDVSPASDVYSVGAVLYELLTGRPPFRGETPLDTVMQVIESEPTPPRKLNAAIPVDMATICLKCLEKQPLRRYATAAALAEELDRFLNQQPIHARAANPLRKLWGMSKRRPWLFTYLAASVAAVLMGMVYWLWSENAFLRFQVEHPDYVRKPGPLSDKFRQGLLFMNFYFPLAFGGLAYHWFRRRRWRRQTISVAVFAAYGTAGAAITLFGLCMGAWAIDAYVWEGHAPWDDIFELIIFTYIGTTIIAHALREYEINAFGTKDEAALSTDQFDEVRRLILDKKEVAAKRYCKRKAASKRAGLEIFYNLRDALREQFPEKFPERTVGGRFRSGCLISLLVILGVIAVATVILAFGLFSGSP
jgi:tRNA A-37 threonylcarbamoyl transferase component Bud32